MLVPDEDLHALLLEAVDDAGAEIDNLFVDVVHELGHALFDVALLLQREVGKEKLLRLVGRQELQLVRILNVHYLIANVVGSLNEIDERMAGVANGAIGSRKLQDAQLAGNFFVVLHLTAEKAELAFVAGKVGREGVLDDACQRAVSHDEAAFATPFEVVGEETEGVGIALEVRDVLPLLWRESVARLGTDVIPKEESVALAEVSADSVLAAMSERRVAKVVSKAGGRDDAAELGEVRAVKFRMLL